LTDAAKNVYKNPEKHDLYKDMQRFLANLRYAKLSSGDIEPLKKEYEANLSERVKSHSESPPVEQSNEPKTDSVVKFEKTKDTIIEMNEVIEGIFGPIAQVAPVIPSYMNPTEASVAKDTANALWRKGTDQFGNKLTGDRKTSKNKKGGKYTRKRNKNKTKKLTKNKTKKRNKPKPKYDSKITIM
jgi:hypothetical protein